MTDASTNDTPNENPQENPNENPAEDAAQGDNAQTAAPGTEQEDADGMPADEQLREPSTEKEPGEEPKAAAPHDPEPSHEAIGIGVVPGEPVDAGPDDRGEPEGGADADQA